MLLCPHCQFENPNTNNFCQRCGTSLIHKTCHECDSQVPLNAETCHNCGAFTGTVWWAIIWKNPDSQIPLTTSKDSPLEESQQIAADTAEAKVLHKEVSMTPDQSQPPQLETSPVATSVSSSLPIENNQSNTDTLPALAPEPIEESLDQPLTSNSSKSNSTASASKETSKSEASSPVSKVVYIDHQQRYQLLEPEKLEKLKTSVATGYGIGVKVLDCQPFQKSPLEALMEQQKDESDQSEYPTSQSLTSNPDSWKRLGIPAIAQPYLAINDQTLPKIHDAWEQDGEAVVLLEDRTSWPLLSDLWGTEELSSLQILYWLDEMAKLWEALEPWQCRQSLLEMTNLRLDEDQALGLVCLYPEVPEKQLTLQDLGQMWQLLFAQSQKTQFSSLVGVFRQMCSNEIKTTSDLHKQLEAIAHEQQSSAPAAGQNSSNSAVPLATDENQSIEADDYPTAGTKSFLDDSNQSSNDDDGGATVILPMQLISLDDAGCTDIGHLRDHNEDYFGIYTQIQKQENPIGRSVKARGLYVLCDGMGGHAAGEVASAMAVETLNRYFQEHWHDQLPTEDIVREAVRLANQGIYDVNQQNARSGSGRMGTTLAMMLVQNTEAVIAHVGDSRVYRLTRKRGLEQLTVDHEVGQREIARGVDPDIAYSRPDAYQLTQALGPRGEQFVIPDVQYLELNEDTLFVLCSDGLSDHNFTETHWQTHLAPLLSSRANLDQGMFQLIELANEHNGHDNITAILIRVKVRPNFEHQRPL
ncbi:MAG TPA: protein phosphatase [Cyanobacteria bacterium UBA8553]|nr:protein phosphatase [Cyanobacteria bacterium UBA8553]